MGEAAGTAGSGLRSVRLIYSGAFDDERFAIPRT